MPALEARTWRLPNAYFERVSQRKYPRQQNFGVETFVANGRILEIRKHRRILPKLAQGNRRRLIRNMASMRTTPTLRVSIVLATLAVTAVACAASPATIASTMPESRATTIAVGVAQITGLAISPLLVLVALGWTEFLNAGGFSATTLPIYANPWLLIPCSVVLALALAKKCVAPAIPLPIRKLFDAGEYLEAKVSALVAAGVLLPSIIATMAAAASVTSATGGDASAQSAGITADWAVYLWMVPAVLVVFGAVWITFHAVDALIVLSPFALIDTLLVALRASVLAMLALSLLVSPILALLLCAPIILLSLLFAGWCVRLDMFALCVALDLLFARAKRSDPSRGPMRAFLATRGHGAPIRTMGHAQPDPAGIAFTYRPLFLLPRRTIHIAASQPTLVRGAIWSTIIEQPPGVARTQRLLAFPPRYTPHAETIATRFRARLSEGVIRRAWHSVRSAIAAILAGSSESPA